MGGSLNGETQVGDPLKGRTIPAILGGTPWLLCPRLSPQFLLLHVFPARCLALSFLGPLSITPAQHLLVIFTLH